VIIAALFVQNYSHIQNYVSVLGDAESPIYARAGIFFVPGLMSMLCGTTMTGPSAALMTISGAFRVLR
jgi:hypothetical protein